MERLVFVCLYLRFWSSPDLIPPKHFQVYSCGESMSGRLGLGFQTSGYVTKLSLLNIPHQVKKVAVHSGIVSQRSPPPHTQTHFDVISEETSPLCAGIYDFFKFLQLNFLFNLVINFCSSTVFIPSTTHQSYKAQSDAEACIHFLMLFFKCFKHRWKTLPRPDHRGMCVFLGVWG